MIIRHVSDTHGDFPEATQEFDITVISGDIFPDSNSTTFSHSAYPVVAANYQKYWLNDNKQKLTDWSGNKPVYFIPGNHDFIDLAVVEEQLGWISITNEYSIYTHNPGLHERDISFYGFPYVPWICGTFNYELSDTAMLAAIQEMRGRFCDEGYPDVLVTHAPPYGILDKAHKNLGNVRLSNALNYTMQLLPKMILCGHIHENHGIQEVNFGDDDFGKLREKVIVSNAATTQHYLEL